LSRVMATMVFILLSKMTAISLAVLFGRVGECSSRAPAMRLAARSRNSLRFADHSDHAIGG
jgi:hypothetical protein